MTAPHEKAIREALPVVAVISERGLNRLANGISHCVHAYAKVVDEDDTRLCKLADAEAQLAELRAEVERLQADERRMDWLEAWHDMPDGGDVGTNMVERTSDGWWSEIGDSEHDTLRAAINAALATKESEHG